jgi:hypothetical protein
MRSIGTWAFPLLSGELSVVEIREGYNSVAMISDKLTTDLIDSKKFSHVAELTYQAVGDEITGVPEGKPYPLVEAGDRDFVLKHFRDGLRIAINKEVIDENDIGNIILRLNFMGKYLAKRSEKRTLLKVTDHHGSKASPTEPRALYLNGTGTALYTTTANAPGPECPAGTRLTNTALVDSDSIELARKHIANYRDTLGERIAIPVSDMVLLVPDALVNVAWRILNSEFEPGVFNEKNTYGPKGLWKPMLVSSPYMDDLSASAWYLGDPKSIFRRKIKQQMENVTLGTQTESYLQSGVAFQARVGQDIDVGAVGYNTMLQCLSGSTAPADE